MGGGKADQREYSEVISEAEELKRRKKRAWNQTGQGSMERGMWDKSLRRLHLLSSWGRLGFGHVMYTLAHNDYDANQKVSRNPNITQIKE